ncbi:hypothetical protein JHK85_014948 [Glycine max]|nr:hypothetical protein JHK85_014948 [Glycine max]
MGETKDEAYEEELLDYEEEDEKAPDSAGAKVNGEATKKGYVGIHSSGFRDFLLKPELLRAIVDSGFEHPSEGKLSLFISIFYLICSCLQHECIPQAILGMDVICQAKSGMGKTAVFVLSTLQQIDPVPGQVSALVLCHTRELAYQICHEFERFSTYLPDLKVAVFYGGVNIKVHKDLLKNECPHIVVGTPGRILALTRDKDLSLKNVRHFILDECDKMLESLDMRKDVQDIFKMTPHDKQVMMFSATLSKEIRPPMEIYVDDEAKLTLHGLVQHYIKLKEEEKNRKLNDLLDALDFNQVVIFVKSVSRAAELDKLLVECNFPSICIHSGMSQEERTRHFLHSGFKEGHTRILVATDLVGRGIDIERVNIVINYDMPDSADTYLHRVGRAGRFGTKGLAITFVSCSTDVDVLNNVQSRFEVDIKQLPEQIDTSTYRISLNPITSLYYVAPCCLVFLSIPWIFVEYPVLRDTSSFHFDFVIFGTNSFCAFALNLAVFLLVGKTSALTMNVAGVVKDWLLIAFSWSVIKDTVTPINLFGYGLAFLGVAYYNHSKLQALKAKEAQKKTAQPDEEEGSLLQDRDDNKRNDQQN